MTKTLLDQLRSTFTPSAVGDLARVVGETDARTQQAVDGLLPAITSGVAHRAQTAEGAATVYHLLTTTPFDTDPTLTQLAQTDSHRQKAAQSGNRLLGELIADRPERLAEATAQYSGVSPGAASTLTGLVMSVLMGYLHQQTKARNLTGGHLVSLLGNEASTVQAAVPAAFAGLIGWFLGTGMSRPVSTVGTKTVSPAPPVDDNRKAAAFPWLRWLLLGLGLLGLLWLLTRSCHRDAAETTTTTSDRTTDTTTTSPNPALVATDTVASDLDGNEPATGDSTGADTDANGPAVRVAVDLPGGRQLNVAEKSFNYSLARFLAVKGSTTPKVFTFDNLTFETNSAAITARARPNVDDLIQIMQAYPSLHIRIEGHTDSTGPDDINDPLSAERADAVKAALVQAGIDAGRLTTRERGDDKPVASNQTEAGREKNRRIDVVVTKL